MFLGKISIASQGDLLDNDGRYWRAVSPKVLIPDFDIGDKINEEDMVYGTLIDIVLSDSNGNTFYVKAVVGDAKSHTYPNEIYHTGDTFPNGTDSHPKNNDGSIVDFMVKAAITRYADYKILKFLYTTYSN